MRFSLARPQEVVGHEEGSRQEITEESARKWSSKLNEQEKKTKRIYSLSNSNVSFHELLALLVIIAFLFSCF